MFPTRLNLLSEKKQHFIRRMMVMSFIKNTLAIVFFVLSFFAIITIFSHILLQAYFADITLQSIRTNNPAKKIDQTVMEINTITKQASAIQSQYIPWSSLLVEVSHAIPEDILISSISIRTDENILEIKGSSPSRESLLALKTTLEALDSIEHVTIPLSDLTRQDRIDFSLSIPFIF